jgi:hypothetical protein
MPALRLLDALAAIGGRHVVVDDRERLFGMADLAAGHAQTLEGLRRGHLMHEMTVDVEQAGAVRIAVDDVVVENLVVEGARVRHVARPKRSVWN